MSLPDRASALPFPFGGIVYDENPFESLSHAHRGLQARDPARGPPAVAAGWGPCCRQGAAGIAEIAKNGVAGRQTPRPGRMCRSRPATAGRRCPYCPPPVSRKIRKAMTTTAARARTIAPMVICVSCRLPCLQTNHPASLRFRTLSRAESYVEDQTMDSGTPGMFRAIRRAGRRT